MANDSSDINYIVNKIQALFEHTANIVLGHKREYQVDANAKWKPSRIATALGYADDIILICPSATAMKEMIEICEGYAKDHNILFNGKKSKYLIFGEYKYNPIITVNNEIVPRCDSAIHLGHLLNTKNTRNAWLSILLKNLIKVIMDSYLNLMDAILQ